MAALFTQQEKTKNAVLFCLHLPFLMFHGNSTLQMLFFPVQSHVLQMSLIMLIVIRLLQLKVAYDGKMT